MTLRIFSVKNGLVRIGIGQIDPKVGDLPENLELIREAVGWAKRESVDLLIFPELALIGYPPRDLLLRRGFVEAAEKAFQAVVKESEKVPIVIGHIAKAQPRPKNEVDPSSSLWQPHFLENAAFLLLGGAIAGYQAKVRLPSFDVFEEERYFLPGEKAEVLEFLGLRLGLSVCEDFWYADSAVAKQCEANVDLLINISASPYFRGKPVLRFSLGKKWAKKANAPVIYANLVGGQDELIFDGRSFCVRPDGEFLLASPAFIPGFFAFELDGKPVEPPEERGIEDVHRALVLGIRDYAQKNGIGKAVIGISGGVDSAVVTVLAVEALGKENVIGVFLPGPYTSSVSEEGAKGLAVNLGIKFLEIPITSAFESLQEILAKEISLVGVVAENLQARLRGVILMAIANALGALVLCPGNKAEIAMGYNTLYGDTVGALAPLGDLLKEDVYALAREINAAGKTIIPEEVIRRPPSAELRPNQRDEDDLPPYAVLDPFLREFLEKNAAQEVLEEKFGREWVQEILRRFYRAEYKRRQLPLVLKVTPKAFGLGWRFPVTHGFHG